MSRLFSIIYAHFDCSDSSLRADKRKRADSDKPQELRRCHYVNCPCSSSSCKMKWLRQLPKKAPLKNAILQQLHVAERRDQNRLCGLRPGDTAKRCVCLHHFDLPSSSPGDLDTGSRRHSLPLSGIGVRNDPLSSPCTRKTGGTAAARAEARADAAAAANPTSAEAITYAATKLLNEVLDASQRQLADGEAGHRRALERAVAAASLRRTYQQLRAVPDRVPRDTGFKSLAHMDTWLWLLCNGDFRVLAVLVHEENRCADEPETREPGGGRPRALPWLDTYVLYRMHQFVPGAALPRLADDFGISERLARALVRCWGTVEQIRLRAIGLPTISEDFCLRPPTNCWAQLHPNMMTTMSDTTNLVFLGIPADQTMSGLVISTYYGGPCLKAMMTTLVWSFASCPPAPCWTGAITDTLHLKANGTLQRQQQLLEEHLAEPGAQQNANVRSILHLHTSQVPLGRLTTCSTRASRHMSPAVRPAVSVSRRPQYGQRRSTVAGSVPLKDCARHRSLSVAA